MILLVSFRTLLGTPERCGQNLTSPDISTLPRDFCGSFDSCLLAQVQFWTLQFRREFATVGLVPPSRARPAKCRSCGGQSGSLLVVSSHDLPGSHSTTETLFPWWNYGMQFCTRARHAKHCSPAAIAFWKLLSGMLLETQHDDAHEQHYSLAGSVFLSMPTSHAGRPFASRAFAASSATKSIPSSCFGLPCMPSSSGSLIAEPPRLAA